MFFAPRTPEFMVSRSSGSVMDAVICNSNRFAQLPFAGSPSRKRGAIVLISNNVCLAPRKRIMASEKWRSVETMGAHSLARFSPFLFEILRERARRLHLSWLVEGQRGRPPRVSLVISCPPSRLSSPDLFTLLSLRPYAETKKERGREAKVDDVCGRVVGSPF